MTAPRKGLTRQQAVQLVLQGIHDDQQSYAELQGLLEEQFQAAMQHRSADLTRLADQVVALVELLDGRRRQRVKLVTALLGAKAGMAQLFALLGTQAREAAEARWTALEALVSECKRLNIRNGVFLTEQHGIMQRVLHGEEDTYAPG